MKYEIPQESLNKPWSSGIQLGQGQMIRPRSRHSDRPGLFRPNMGYNSGVSLLQWGKFLNCRCNLLLLPTSRFISIYLLNTLDSNVSFPLSNLAVMQGHDDPKKFRGSKIPFQEQFIGPLMKRGTMLCCKLVMLSFCVASHLGTTYIASHLGYLFWRLQILCI